MFLIRQETSSDYEEVYRLAREAFATASHSDGTEADYLNDVRKQETFIPELSLVAENKAGKIVGQIVLYWTDIQTKTGKVEALVLSPISVHPSYFRQGIARQLIEQAATRAAGMGFIAVFLCGAPEIYNKLGFSPTYEWNIFHKNDAAAEWCMGRELFVDSLANIRGVIDIV